MSNTVLTTLILILSLVLVGSAHVVSAHVVSANTASTNAAYTQNVVKQVVPFEGADVNLLQADRFRLSGSARQLDDGVFVLDHGADATASSGVMQTLVLNQVQPDPIVVEAWSRAENVSGTPSVNYAIYLDITYVDGTNLWGQTVAFPTGTQDWNKRTLPLNLDRPVRRIDVYFHLRNKSGRVYFREAKASVLRTPEGAVLFDGMPVIPKRQATLQIRDVAANSDFIELQDIPFGVIPTVRQMGQITQVTLVNSDAQDRCLTLVYAITVSPEGLVWCEHPRLSIPVEPNMEYLLTTSMPDVGSNGRLSLYPFAAVAGEQQGGIGVGIDLKTPAFFRTGYNSGTSELYVAVDLALTRESPMARINFVRLSFDPQHAFRGALDAYYRLFPSYFASRTPEQGIWIPFQAPAHIPDWEDFGFQFVWGTDPAMTAWSNANNLLAFRYTAEPNSWFMQIPSDLPHTYEGGLVQLHRLAANPTAGRDHRDHFRALSVINSGAHDPDGNLVGVIGVHPWSPRGVRWFMNDLPGIEGGSFSVKWNQEILEREYYSTDRQLCGEAIDSVEHLAGGLDFRRENFIAAHTPLVFSRETHQPAILGGLITFEFVRAIAEDMRRRNKLMASNYTPDHLCWLVPWIDLPLTETNWNSSGRWRPMPDADMLYRRALSGQKPFGFLMNTNFTQWTHELSERYMQRSLAYGMFPSFFSANARDNRYFDQPALFERDRSLFKKYIPLIKLVAEAGWQPLTLATSSEPRVYIERFGSTANHLQHYFTVFNDSPESQTTTLRFENTYTAFKDLVSGETQTLVGGILTLTLPSERVALLQPIE